MCDYIIHELLNVLEDQAQRVHTIKYVLFSNTMDRTSSFIKICMAKLESRVERNTPTTVNYFPFQVITMSTSIVPVWIGQVVKFKILTNKKTF